MSPKSRNPSSGPFQILRVRFTRQISFVCSSFHYAGQSVQYSISRFSVFVILATSLPKAHFFVFFLSFSRKGGIVVSVVLQFVVDFNFGFSFSFSRDSVPFLNEKDP